MRKTWRTLIYQQVYLPCAKLNQIWSEMQNGRNYLSQYSSTMKQYMQYLPISEKKYSDFTFIAIYLQILLDYSVVSRYFCWCCNWYFSIRLRNSNMIVTVTCCPGNLADKYISDLSFYCSILADLVQQGWTITSVVVVTDISQWIWGTENMIVTVTAIFGHVSTCCFEN